MSLIHEITKNNSSFLKRTKLYNRASFNSNPLNPLNINSGKYALGTNQSVSVDVTPKGALLIKKASSADARKPSQYIKKTKITKGYKSINNYAKNIVEATEGEDFRSDLKLAVVARAAKLLRLKQKAKKNAKAPQK